MANFCPNCGNKLNKGAKFCSACGKSLNESAGEILVDNVVEKVSKLNETITNKLNESKTFQKDNRLKDQSFFDYFFRKDGRLNRQPFNIRLIAIYISRYILVSVMWLILSDSYGELTTMGSIVLFLFACVFIYSNYCINIRREQDLANKTESVDGEKNDRTTLSEIIAVFDIIFMVMEFWPDPHPKGKVAFFVEYRHYIALAVMMGQVYFMARKGVNGPNRYGPDPLQ
ncbi:MAG: DUF805 domain-containing protein [Veillonella sp.]|uniref:zinc-ribbon domain-containing protein n=1 Tax=Veillonella sp. TaxID=1926307 RepID=UPI0025D1A7E5|nr:DUF805 domain-containing protein [Veillonella sp.]MBS4912976.1 DUF805 domain-containing protein [Veillonella sp.]